MSARGTEAPGGEISVLVVDDSAVVRQMMAAVLSPARGMRVTAAADPVIAIEKMKTARPDVIVLDLEMPRMDGLTFLRRVMAEDPIPIVVCSGLVGGAADAAVKALEEGAVEVIAKPRLGLKDFLQEQALLLVDAVRGAARGRCHRPRRVALERPEPAAPPPPKPGLRSTTDKVLAIGASTGGTEAIRAILEAMPPDAPGIVVVQHMPEVFTAAFAQRLDRLCRIEVKEAADGDRVLAGRALIAPGNRHMVLRRSGAHYTVEVSSGPLVSRHRPSADVLFQSVAHAAGQNAVGVILTGMGDDGADGLLAMRQARAFTIAQDEATCVVFGMPKEAIARGAVDETLPLPRIPGAALRECGVRNERQPAHGRMKLT